MWSDRAITVRVPKLKPGVYAVIVHTGHGTSQRVPFVVHHHHRRSWWERFWDWL